MRAMFDQNFIVASQIAAHSGTNLQAYKATRYNSQRVSIAEADLSRSPAANAGICPLEEGVCCQGKGFTPTPLCTTTPRTGSV
jgi:hypothetical protein